jgi:hypothetical protein
MALYLISYDIAEKDAFEYEGLWAALRAIGATKILYSEWVLPGELNGASGIYNKVCGLVQGKGFGLESAPSTPMLERWVALKRRRIAFPSSAVSGSACRPPCHQNIFILAL